MTFVFSEELRSAMHEEAWKERANTFQELSIKARQKIVGTYLVYNSDYGDQGEVIAPHLESKLGEFLIARSLGSVKVEYQQHIGKFVVDSYLDVVGEILEKEYEDVLAKIYLEGQASS